MARFLVFVDIVEGGMSLVRTFSSVVIGMIKELIKELIHNGKVLFGGILIEFCGVQVTCRRSSKK